MAAFPAIEPKNRSYDLAGDFPMVAEEAWPSGSVRYATGLTPFTNTGLQLTLTYENISDTDALLLLEHYKLQQGGLIDFLLPAVIWQGHASDLVPSGTRWRYVEPVQVESRKGALANVSVVLEAMAFDYGAVLPETKWRINVSIGAGVGLQSSVGLSLQAGGTAFSGATLSATASVSGGSATGDANVAGITIIVNASLSPGAAAGNASATGMTSTVAASVSGGAATGS